MKKFILLFSVLLIPSVLLIAQPSAEAKQGTEKKTTEKELFLPDTIYRIPNKNDFNPQNLFVY